MRRQPFAGAFERLMRSPDTSDTPAKQHTFFRHNAKAADAASLAALPESPDGLERFDWFVHLDRKLTSPIELIHVSAVTPWQVSQRFISADPAAAATDVLRQAHTAPWFDQWLKIDTTSAATMYQGPDVGGGVRQPYAPLSAANSAASTRLYRALEYFRCGDHTVEMAFGGRDIGKVNINTIWDKAVFDAVFDAPKDLSVNPPIDFTNYKASVGFTQRDVDNTWYALDEHGH